MTVHNRLCIAATVLAVVGLGGTPVYAEGDVTVISTPAATTAPSQKAVASDGTPVVHKSLHKKKKSTTETASGAGAATTPTASMSATQPQSTAPTTTAQPSAIAPANTASQKSAQVSSSTAAPVASAPTVETGLPVAHYSGMGAPIKGVSTYIPTTGTQVPAKSVAGATTHLPFFASSTLPASVVPMTSSAAGSYSTPSRSTTSTSDVVFTNFKKKVKVTYPWKTGIITTMLDWRGRIEYQLNHQRHEFMGRGLAAEQPRVGFSL